MSYREFHTFTTDISPANVEAATLFKDNKQEYERRVKVSELKDASPS